MPPVSHVPQRTKPLPQAEQCTYSSQYHDTMPDTRHQPGNKAGEGNTTASFLRGSTQSGDVGNDGIWVAVHRPRLRIAVEVIGRDTGHVGNVAVIGQRLSGEGFAPKDPPPALDEIEPGGADRDGGVVDAGMGGQPLADGATTVAGEIIGDEIQVTVGIGVIEGLEKRALGGRVARRCRLGQRLPVAHTQRPVDPDLVGATRVVERHFDAVAIH